MEPSWTTNFENQTGECTSASPGSLAFTKISQAALLSGSDPGTWVTDTLIRDNFTSQVQIPSSLRPGNYVLRHEIIALHAAGSPNGAQAYPQCLNVKVGSGGAAGLAGGVPATSLYSASDPGILFSLYGSFSSYPIPGPALNGGGGGGGGSSGGGNNGGGNGGGNQPQPTTMVTTTAAPAPTGGNGGGGCSVAKYQQCGGQGYSGCTVCASGSTCNKQNDYYHQCM